LNLLWALGHLESSNPDCFIGSNYDTIYSSWQCRLGASFDFNFINLSWGYTYIIKMQMIFWFVIVHVDDISIWIHIWPTWNHNIYKGKICIFLNQKFVKSRINLSKLWHYNYKCWRKWKCIYLYWTVVQRQLSTLYLFSWGKSEACNATWVW